MLPIFLLLSCIIVNRPTIVYSSDKIPNIIPKKVSVTSDSQGYPTINALKTIVAMYYLKSNNYNFSIKEITGGLYSEKLYIVLSKQNGQKTPLFFLKISKKPQSTQNLIDIQEGPIGQKFKDLNNTDTSPCLSQQNLPIIIWLENVLICQNQQGSKKTIEVTKAAQGNLMHAILLSHDLTATTRAAHAIGKSLASFHQLFINYNDSENPCDWTTTCHGDFGMKNVLFSPTNHKVYFIDNEGMNTNTIDCDINAFLISFGMFLFLREHYATRWPLYLQYCLAFLKGYINAYPSEQQERIALFIEKKIQKYLKHVLSKRFNADNAPTTKYFNEKEFKKLIYNYLQTFHNA